MDENLLKLKFEAEQKRSRQIDRKLKDDAPSRVPKQEPQIVAPTVVAPSTTIVEEIEVSQAPAPAEPKPDHIAATANNVYAEKAGKRKGNTMSRLGGMSFRDAIVLSEIIAKPVSKRTR